MKTIHSILALLLLLLAQFGAAQEKTKPTMTVLHIDVKGVGLDPESAGNMVRREVEKLNLFDVTDRYDVSWLLEKNQLKVANCYGKLCLVEIGKTIQSEKMLSGSIEMYSDIIVITLRIIDVKSASVERTSVKEFLNLPKEVKNMVAITLREMFGIENERALVESLTVKNAFANSINQPNKNRLALDGPRMGCTVLTGTNADIFKAPRSEGGFDGFPAMFQFGYQFEKQYLNEGNFQALFEFIPMITGLDQGMFIPSMTILHGLRGNKKGWEFAFGPTIGLMRKADGYYDPDAGWQLSSSWSDSLNPNPYPIVSRMDSRGDYALSSGFVFAFGRSFKSGKLNIPFNAYIVPQRHGMRVGVSFGFNARK